MSGHGFHVHGPHGLAVDHAGQRHARAGAGLAPDILAWLRMDPLGTLSGAATAGGR
ncbi:hypothetical protein [Pseudoduganella chitinolytica]|uniref:Uncharacterized protein n=1 Tax=Pseudoduganella chitinolytica TaxID=34070 RepID=A0ABY8BFU1_9BURK|nr:hypothetical protein [Pseudoduganella chitinolytica]WEF34690.1 hypothetical protein PX653_08000 [Pseudoduganella chitinolytica]